MRSLYAIAGAGLFALNLASFAETEVVCGQTLDSPLPSRAMLTIDSRPAGLEIVATDHEGIHISCTSDDSEVAGDTRLRFSQTRDGGELKIRSAFIKSGNLQIRIEVPRRTNLKVNMAAGEVRVNEVLGDKDIDLTTGQITISSNRDWDYRHIDISANIGQVNAPAYRVKKGGFFRSFSNKSASGEYRLHAHVTTGQIDLLGTNGGPE
jgi:hypothetical protein